jgi:hypothetical protein
MLQPGALSREFWDQVQSRLAIRVRDCNAVAGEPLWTIAKIEGPAEGVVVASVTEPLARVEVSFDPDKGLLVCSPGAAVKAAPLHFRWRCDGLTLDDTLCSLDAALGLVLDELVAADSE